MPIINRIAYYQNRRDEVPNQELARDLAENKNSEGIREIAENLWNKDPNVAFDCVKVLYEIGYHEPRLIADYVSDFLKLIESRHNRLIWGGMLALSTIAAINAEEIFPHYELIKKVMEKGSVITVDNGVKILAILAAQNNEYSKVIFPYLLEHLKTCRPKSVPQHSEAVMPAANPQNKREFIQLLEKRLEDMSLSQAVRVRRVIREAKKR